MKNFNCMDLILVYISKKAVSMTETLEKISPCQITLLSTKYFLYFSIQFWTPDLGILEVHHAGLLTIENYFPHMTPRKKKKSIFFLLVMYWPNRLLKRKKFLILILNVDFNNKMLTWN